MSFLLSFSIWAATVDSGEEYEKYVNEIVQEFRTEMARDYNLICIGGGGRMPYDVEEIKVEFHAQTQATLEEARELEIKVTQRFLDKINQHTKIRPFLREHPFKPFRAEVSITFVNEQGHWWPPNESIAFVFQVKNKIHYFKNDLLKECAIKIHTEPYDEAEKLVDQGPSHDFKGKKI